MKNFSAILFLVLVGSLVFGLALRGVKGNPTIQRIKDTMDIRIRPYGTTERPRYILTENLVKNHSFALSKDQADAGAPDVSYYNGNWYLQYAPGVSVITIPFYILGEGFGLAHIFTILGVTFFSIINLIIIYIICKNIIRLPHWASIFSSITFGFATVGVIYATSLYQHQITVFLMLSGFFSIYKYRQKSKFGILWAIYAWATYAIGFFVDYSNAILLLPVAAYLILSSISFIKEDERYKFKIRIPIFFSFLFFLLLTFFHGYYNKTNFGNWTTLSGSLPGYREIIDQKTKQTESMQDLEKLKQIQENKTPVNFFSEFKLGNGFRLLTFAPEKGLFVFNSILMLGIFGMLLATKTMNLEKIILFSFILINFFYYASWGDPWGGWAFGPRYLVPSMAVLSIFVSYFLVNVKYKLTAKIVAFILFVVSAAISLMGAVTTIATPPKVEAIPLKIKFGMAYTYDFITKNESSNFIYKYYLLDKISLFQYWMILLTLVTLLALIVLFILPRFEKEEQQKL